MTHLKVIPIRGKEITKSKLIRAVGKVLARDGFRNLGVTAVAREAGVDKKLIYRYYHGLPNLVAAYSKTVEFWPPARELMGGDVDYIREMPSGQLMALFFKRYLGAIMRRPETLDILAWEAVEQNDLTRCLEGVRVRTALEFFEYMRDDPPDDVDLTALVAFMAGAVNFFAVRSRNHRTLGGIDIQSREGIRRLERTIDLLMKSTLHGER